MKKLILNSIFLFLVLSGCTQELSFREDLKQFWDKQNAEMRDAKKSPLEIKERLTFDSIAIFPLDSNYRVQAKFIRTKKEETFKMQTSTDRLPEYVKYGELHFDLKKKKYSLNVYQSIELTRNPEYKNYLFVPFTDLTNGVETYGGGRYMDMEIPRSKNVIIDFNKAYNPYCVYNYNYSCPIPPRENHLDVRIEAGALNYEHP